MNIFTWPHLINTLNFIKNNNIKIIIFKSLTSGGGVPVPVHSMCPPVVFENSTLWNGSCKNMGPCRSKSFTPINDKKQTLSKKKYFLDKWETIFFCRSYLKIKFFIYFELHSLNFHPYLILIQQSSYYLPLFFFGYPTLKRFI